MSLTTTAGPPSVSAIGRPRPRRVLRRLAPVAVVTMLVLGGAACAPPKGGGNGIAGDVVAAVNQDRAANGLAPLAWDAQLAQNAQSWANHLAATGSLTHTDLQALIRLPHMAAWWTLGENLLVGPAGLSGAAAEGLWMGSGSHRANILGANFNHIGVAAVSDNTGRLWLVAEFGAR